MVRCAAAALLLLLATAAMAQEGASPPAVMTEAPALGDVGTATEAAPLLPSATVADPAGAFPAEAAEPGEVDTDLLRLIRRAHPVVQAVMGLLALAVLAVMTVFLFKIVEFTLAFAKVRRASSALATTGGLVELPGDCPLARAAAAALDEVSALPHALTAELRASAWERLELRLDRIEAGAVQRLRSGTGLLASIGAVGPFVGLFGTVFGIMNSFLAIAASKTTNLAVVAPGIAEALLATGIGLVAAIPAVLLYNAVMRRIGLFRHALADGRAEILARFSRQMDRRMGG
ncbi:MAG: MotA/TolQ/ExbB proton channel family protein [Rhodobacterales bacterium]|nr:MotA/TolQ/ExbB proton channel family protein [Rhodobacterales bacterium]